MEAPFLLPVSAGPFWCLVFDVCPTGPNMAGRQIAARNPHVGNELLHLDGFELSSWCRANASSRLVRVAPRSAPLDRAFSNREVRGSSGRPFFFKSVRLPSM